MHLLEGSFEACVACILLTAAQGSWSVVRVANNVLVTAVGRAMLSDAKVNVAKETKARTRPPIFFQDAAN
jgi:hypothetical protein